jgi:asparagine synthase (glutamine-hydrolysing)
MVRRDSPVELESVRFLIMCGILGWVGPQSVTGEALEGCHRGIAALRNRGPDDRAIARGEDWVLGHTRLKILDLSKRAAQPMRDAAGRLLVFNGEIYNFQELRAELETRGARLRSTGDTEVLLEALAQWGLDALKRLRGMFAFAWLDPKGKQLILARDRFGVKPLAWERTADGIRFGSDLFALDAMAGGTQRREIDPEQTQRYLMLGYVPAPYTIWKAVRKLLPGHYLRVVWNDGGTPSIEEKSYWKISDVPPSAKAPAHVDELEAFSSELGDAIRLRLVSDVPIGLLLSGGIDSSLVAAALARIPDIQVPSFTMGFAVGSSDERHFARDVAKRFKLEHREFLAEEEDLAAVFDRLWQAFDEPFADSSALPMLVLCREIRKHVTVAIGGDGGDEVWCGYPWHRAFALVNKGFSVPLPLRSWLSVAADKVGGLQWRYKARVLAGADRLSAWARLRTGLSDEMAKFLPAAAPSLPVAEHFREAAERVGSVPEPLDWASRMDLMTYLPDDLMVKTDRSSMHVGLELREPLLDHELSAFGLAAPINLRFDRRRRQGKVLPRQYLSKFLADSLLERPKQGFTPPLVSWLDGPLFERKSEAIERLEADRLDTMALPHGSKSWEECSDKLDDMHHQFLWRVVCFSGWLTARATRNRASDLVTTSLVH